MNKNSLGVIIGRFQSPIFHDGYKSLISTVAAKHQTILILVGCTRGLPTNKNPYNFEIRKSLIEGFIGIYPNHRITITPIFDCRDDRDWSNSVDQIIESANLIFNLKEPATLYGGRNSFISSYCGKNFTIDLCEQIDNKACSSTKCREEALKSAIFNKEGRIGYLQAVNALSSVVSACVDIALINHYKKEILLGKKINEAAWRLPGGFVDTSDASLESAAKRELSEECGILETSNWCFIDSYTIDDWRYRQTERKVISSLYTCSYNYGIAKAGDDLAQVHWFSLEQLLKGEVSIVQEHKTMINQIIDREDK